MIHATDDLDDNDSFSIPNDLIPAKGQLIGQGACGEVHKSVLQDTEVAVKIISHIRLQYEKWPQT